MPEGTADNIAGGSVSSTTLGQRLETIRLRYPDMDPIMVADVVRAVLGTMHGDLTAAETGLLAEVAELGRTIAAVKSDIAALRVDDITGNHIPSATDELDAIVAHTAAATDQILETCETLDAVGASLTGEPKEQLQDATTRIYEACSFQDITGQRISKVVAALKTIEQKVAMLVHTFSDDPATSRPEQPSEEASLLNGPQLPGNAMDQSDIDRLLASFD